MRTFKTQEAVCDVSGNSVPLTTWLRDAWWLDLEKRHTPEELLNDDLFAFTRSSQ